MPAEAQLGDQWPMSKVHGPQLHRHKLRRGLFPSLYMVFFGGRGRQFAACGCAGGRRVQWWTLTPDCAIYSC